MENTTTCTKKPFVTDENYTDIVLFLADCTRRKVQTIPKPDAWHEFVALHPHKKPWGSDGSLIFELHQEVVLYLETKLLPTEDEMIIEELYQYHQKRDPRP